MQSLTKEQQLIRQLLIKNSWSRKELAEKLGVQKRTVDGWLINPATKSYRNIQKPTLMLLNKLF